MSEYAGRSKSRGATQGTLIGDVINRMQTKQRKKKKDYAHSEDHTGFTK